MNIDDVIKIFEKDSGFWKGDNAFQGLLIISKYTDCVIQGAGHDIIHSESIETLIEAGMKKEEFEELRRLNWHIEDDYLACFV